MAVKQRDTEALLKRADLTAHRRLAQIQGLAGMGKAARLGDSVEDPQLVPIHPQSPNSGVRAVELAVYSAARMVAGSSRAARNFSASSAAMQPNPAAVTA